MFDNEAALTADRDTDTESGYTPSYQVKGSTTIYLGSIVCVELSSGYVVPGSDTSGLVYVGIAEEYVDNSSGSNGDKSVRVNAQPGLTALLTASGLAISDIGDQLYISDDQTVAKSTTNSIKIGKLAYFESATSAPVRCEPLTA
jgi:hypothetical protein